MFTYLNYCKFPDFLVCQLAIIPSDDLFHNDTFCKRFRRPGRDLIEAVTERVESSCNRIFHLLQSNPFVHRYGKAGQPVLVVRQGKGEWAFLTLESTGFLQSEILQRSCRGGRKLSGESQTPSISRHRNNSLILQMVFRVHTLNSSTHFTARTEPAMLEAEIRMDGYSHMVRW